MPSPQSIPALWANRRTQGVQNKEDPTCDCAPAERPRGARKACLNLGVVVVLLGSLPRCSLLEAPAAASAPGEHARGSGLAFSRYLIAPCFVSHLSSGRIWPGDAELGRRTIKQVNDPREGMIKGNGVLASRLAGICTNIALCSPRHKPRDLPALLQLRGGGRPPQASHSPPPSLSCRTQSRSALLLPRRAPWRPRGSRSE